MGAEFSRFADELLPQDLHRATLVARLQVPGEAGARIATVRGDHFIDITTTAVTVADLLESDDPVEVVRTAPVDASWEVGAVVAATLEGAQDAPRLVSPIDLQVIKAAGVTFASSMIERVIEERAAGDAARAHAIRERIAAAIGGALRDLVPGSERAAQVKELLIEEGLWSQYLEVGIGPDPEIFTKAPVLSSVGTGADVGVLARSEWNNPEPEVVVVGTSSGIPVGACLGNDVNLRDFEGRSALLLGEAKDNNASCALGPVIRLFDEQFTLNDVRAMEVALDIVGEDGFVLNDGSSTAEMSRTIEELISATIGRHHQYPDGFALFTGTLFAPTQDRDAAGMGFTHHRGDVVAIANPSLGTLVNRVVESEEARPWETGIRAFMADLARRGLLADSGGAP
ncbi:MAG: fumarylacetoacetate hydrolase [Nocardioides sp.]|nr:fumarylacetoacetate hydrolase [Nocardioides sp.]